MDALVLKNGMMSSLEIAELTGKQHKHVMESIRIMEPAWMKINGSKFRLVEYRDAKGEMGPMYQLTRPEYLYVATKFNDKSRAKLVLRWGSVRCIQTRNWMRFSQTRIRERADLWIP